MKKQNLFSVCPRYSRMAAAALSLTLLPSLIAAHGCGGGTSTAILQNSEETGSSASGLVGSWRAVRISAGGNSVTCPGDLFLPQENDTCGFNDVIRFAADGTFTSSFTNTFGAFALSGRWSRSGDTVTLTITNTAVDPEDDGTFDPADSFVNTPPDIATVTVANLSNSSLTIRTEEEQVPVETTFTRL